MSAVLKLNTEGAKKGGGGGGSESPDTLTSNETIKILHLLGEGEINLFTGDAKSIFLNSTPLQKGIPHRHSVADRDVESSVSVRLANFLDQSAGTRWNDHPARFSVSGHVLNHQRSS
jgi:hypothetical protein